MHIFGRMGLDWPQIFTDLHGRSVAEEETEDLLADSNLLWSLHPSGSVLAIALNGRLTIASQQRKRDDSRRHFCAKLCEPPAAISALCWAAFYGLSAQAEHACVLAGSSEGLLYLLSSSGSLLQQQQITTSPILNIRCRACGMGIDPADPMEDITLNTENSVMRLRAIELLTTLRGHRIGSWSSADSPMLTIDTWDLPRSVGPRKDAFCAGAMPPNFYNTLANDDADLVFTCIHTAGSSPSLASLEAVSEAKESLLSSAASLIGRVTKRASGFGSSVASAYKSASIANIYCLASSAVSFRTSSDTSAPERTSRIDSELPAGKPCSLWRSLDDPGRDVVLLLPSPKGGLMAARDLLGRILLIDTPTSSVRRLWKGYRDAMLGWLDLPRQSSDLLESNSHQGAVALCLAIYAPRKSLVEIWEVFRGIRRCAFRCTTSCCRLLQPEAALSSLASADGHLISTQGVSTCYMLDIHSGLVDVAQHAHHAESQQTNYFTDS